MKTMYVFMVLEVKDDVSLEGVSNRIFERIHPNQMAATEEPAVVAKLRAGIEVNEDFVYRKGYTTTFSD